MQHTCGICRASFVIHDDERAFLEKQVFTFGSKKIHPALPTFCPDCRLRRRTCHRNERFMYRRPSCVSGKEIVSLIHEEPLWGKSYKVCTYDEWNDDRNDFSEFGRDIDWSRPFFEQFADLHKTVPRMALTVVGNENCDFTTGTGYCRNCYLINSSEYAEDCYYGKLFQKCRNSVDCSYLYGSELCYECFTVYHSYNCTHLSFSKNCQDCLFSVNLIGCKNCLLCSNLVKKQYCIENRQCTKDEFETRVSELRGSFAHWEEAKRKLETLRRTMVHRACNIVQSEDCTGDQIENSRHCIDCYDVNESQDCRYVHVGVNVKDNYDCSNMYLKPELCYETLGTIEVYNSAYCLYVFHCQNMLYSQYCYSCQDCFGCDGLRRKQYCILNKQYTKEEYEELVPRLIEHMERGGEWGQFYPPSLSPYGFNESVAHEYLPLPESEARKQGFLWREMQEKKLDVSKTIQAGDLPDSISDIPDDVLNWAIVCNVTSRPFRIVRQELEFYRRNGIPVPRVHPDERYDARLRLRNPRRLWTRSCAKCDKEMLTTFAPGMKETVYCEECYRAAVY